MAIWSGAFVEREEALWSIGVGLIQQFDIFRTDPLDPYSSFELDPTTAKIFQTIGCVFVEKGFFNEAVDISVICAKTVFKGPEKAKQ